MSTRYDVVVVGCGGVGSAVSQNLSSRGMKVLTLEKFGLNHENGSSHGKTRIIRLAYYEDERYVPLLRRAFELWRELERKTGKTLMRLTGGLMMGNPEGELLTGVLRSVKTHGIPYRMLSASETEARFEAFDLDESFSAVFEENAGILFPEECIEASVQLAKEAACEFRFNEEVTKWRSGPPGVKVQTSKGGYAADKVVFCTGAWTGRLLGRVIPLEIERQVPLWFSSGGLDFFTPARMPIFISEESGKRFFYGIPDVGHGVKVARTHGGVMVDPDTVSRKVTDEDTKPVKAFASERLPMLGREPIASTTCRYANTPDLNFAVGLLPKDPRVAVVSACSGHGFKFTGVLGEVVADLVTSGRSRFDISFIGLDRFSGE